MYSPENLEAWATPSDAQVTVMWETKAEGNVDKIKCPDHLQPIDKYLRQAKYRFLQEVPNYLPVNVLLEGKVTLV